MPEPKQQNIAGENLHSQADGLHFKLRNTNLKCSSNPLHFLHNLTCLTQLFHAFSSQSSNATASPSLLKTELQSKKTEEKGTRLYSLQQISKAVAT